MFAYRYTTILVYSLNYIFFMPKAFQSVKDSVANNKNHKNHFLNAVQIPFYRSIKVNESKTQNLYNLIGTNYYFYSL